MTKDNTANPAGLHALSWQVAPDGALSVAPDTGPLGLRGLTGAIRVDGEDLSLAGAEAESRETAGGDGARRITTTFSLPGRGLRWVRQTDEDGHLLTVHTTLENTGDADRTIGSWDVLAAAGAGCVDLGREPDHVRFFGWRGWAMQVERFAAADGLHRAANLCHLYDPGSGAVLLVGYLTLDRMLVDHALTYEHGKGATGYRATCRAGGFRLRPGQSLAAEALQISYHSDPRVALEAWADRVHRHYRPRLDERPLVIWSGGAWLDGFSTGEESWEALALANGRALREQLAGFDVTHVWTSQHNLKDGLPGNWLTGNDEQIPSGMAAFCQALRDLGIGHKLWFSPFWFFAEAGGVLEENTPNLLRDEAGEPITEPAAWEWDVDIEPTGAARLTRYFLDGTHPQTHAYVRRIFAAYRALGADAYMLDFLTIKEGARLHDDGLLPVEAARQILQVIREAAGRDAHLQTAVASTPGFIGLVSSARIGRDFGEGRPLFPPFPLWHNATYVRHDRHFANTHAFVQNAAANWFTHNRLYCNDLNILTVDKPVPLEQARIASTLFGLSGGSPLTLGDDYRHIAPERLRLVKVCLPRTGGVPVPVDLFDSVAPDGYCRLLALPVTTAWDDYVLVSVYNDEGEGYDGEIELERVGLDPGAAYRVYEFWNEEYVGTFRGRCPCAVPPGAIRLYRIGPARPHPWLLGTDLHIQQGAVEIESLDWDAQRLTLSGVAARPAGEAGNLFLHLPRQYRLLNHAGVGLMKEVRDMTVVARVPVAFAADRHEFAYRFEILEVPNVSWSGWLPYTTEAEWRDYVEAHRVPADTRVIE